MDGDDCVVRNSNHWCDELARGGPAPACTQSLLPLDSCSVARGQNELCRCSSFAHHCGRSSAGSRWSSDIHSDKYLQKNDLGKDLKSHFTRLKQHPCTKGISTPARPCSPSLKHMGTDPLGNSSLLVKPLRQKTHSATPPPWEQQEEPAQLGSWGLCPSLTLLLLQSFLLTKSCHSPLPDFNSTTSTKSININSALVRPLSSLSGQGAEQLCWWTWGRGWTNSQEK